MFGWLKGLFRKKKNGTHGAWAPAERLIYEYFDGDKLRKADPMPLYQKVLARRAELRAAWETATLAVPNDFSEKAQRDLVNGSREVFSLPKLGPNDEVEYEADGKQVKTLSDMECLSLLNDFLVFTEHVKKVSGVPSGTQGNAEATANGTAGG